MIVFLVSTIQVRNKTAEILSQFFHINQSEQSNIETVPCYGEECWPLTFKQWQDFWRIFEKLRTNREYLFFERTFMKTLNQDIQCLHIVPDTLEIWEGNLKLWWPSIWAECYCIHTAGCCAHHQKSNNIERIFRTSDIGKNFKRSTRRPSDIQTGPHMEKNVERIFGTSDIETVGNCSLRGSSKRWEQPESICSLRGPLRRLWIKISSSLQMFHWCSGDLGREPEFWQPSMLSWKSLHLNSGLLFQENLLIIFMWLIWLDLLDVFVGPVWYIQTVADCFERIFNKTCKQWWRHPVAEERRGPDTLEI